jgi:CheY-like chemotaxis protein
MRRLGADVTVATSGADAESRLAGRERFHLVISDVGREGNDEAGFEDLERFRANSLYDGPALFFTSRVTPERRQRAAKASAAITNDGAALMQQIRTSLPTPSPVPR